MGKISYNVTKGDEGMLCAVSGPKTEPLSRYLLSSARVPTVDPQLVIYNIIASTITQTPNLKTNSIFPSFFLIKPIH